MGVIRKLKKLNKSSSSASFSSLLVYTGDPSASMRGYLTQASCWDLAFPWGLEEALPPSVPLLGYLL